MAFASSTELLGVITTALLPGGDAKLGLAAGTNLWLPLYKTVASGGNSLTWKRLDDIKPGAEVDLKRRRAVADKRSVRCVAYNPATKRQEATSCGSHRSNADYTGELKDSEWVDCAREGGTCTCAGVARFGFADADDAGHLQPIWSQASAHQHTQQPRKSRRGLFSWGPLASPRGHVRPMRVGYVRGSNRHRRDRH